MIHAYASTRSEADFSACGRFRFWICREWGVKKPFGVFFMINPSRADALALDPTSMMCTNLALLWGWRGFGIVNLHPWIDPAPNNPIAVPSLERRANDHRIIESYSFSDIFVLATGEDDHALMISEIVRLRLPNPPIPNKNYSIGEPNAEGSYPHPGKWSRKQNANLPKSPRRLVILIKEEHGTRKEAST
jgi:hypothetical protein